MAPGLAPDLHGRRPEPGPISVLPRSEDAFAAAVEAAGGTLVPLSTGTRGLIWLSSERAGELNGVLAANPQIGWVQLPWAGVDAFTSILDAPANRHVLWTSAKGAYAQPVAEHALALILATLRVLPRRARATSWDDVPAGRSLYGRRVVIVGAGGIALELLRLLEPFGVHTTIVRRSAQPVRRADRTVTAAALVEVLPDAEVLVIAAALTGETRHLIGADELAVLGADAVVVNIARGGLIDTDALVAALAAGTIAGAALDVTDPEPLPDGHPLWTEPRCLITPHMADTPEMTTALLAERIRVNVRAFLENSRFVGVVDPRAGY
ncbi:D-isomer specific 2-hydroxyacid dehydrogenase family protein [Glaciibacter psychrotolerans]|uniref:D-isomer specific 2-hydroxyacid dehydrogenase family protein n=1 Tax=Glaciibacter psychrotolerans TaxID=670054 RepID=UPI001FE3E94C|nr:D-isomer specific 2-hydroxyacid dehydrogenase family protein [Leifsonia psychrotolerans]